MSSRTVVRALHRTLTVLLVFAVCASQVSVALAGNYRIGSVGGVVIQIDGVVPGCDVACWGELQAPTASAGTANRAATVAVLHARGASMP